MIVMVLLFLGIGIILNSDAKPNTYLIQTMDENSSNGIGSIATDNEVDKTAIDIEEKERKTMTKKGGSDYCHWGDCRIRYGR